MMPRSPSRLFLAAYFSLVAVVGCGAQITGATTSATGTGGGDASDAGTHGGGAGGMDSGSGVSCQQCACEDWTSMGCAYFCTGGLNGPHMEFCDGYPALVPCAECLAMNCPGVDPNDPCACCPGVGPNDPCACP